ncbi:MAG: GNAT family N-acetyltransferase [Flavobacteriales bacterium]|nr:GNAT family N-acetyltransferase [Flavobacteriales bacterium]
MSAPPPSFALRPWRTDDLPDLVRWADDADIASNLTNTFPHPYTEADGIAFLNRFRNDAPVRVFAIVVDDHAVGSIGVFPQDDIFHRNAELGYWLAAPFRGRGIVPAAIRQVVDYAFLSWPLHRVFARPFGSNRSSQRALEKAGFTLEARLAGTIEKNGRIEDELIYAVRRPSH